MTLPLHLDLLRLALPRTRETATSISALAALLERPDREIRDQIKDLNEFYRLGVIVLPIRNGVWLAESPEQIDRMISCQVSRARSIERSVKVLRQLRDAMAFEPALF